MAASIGGPESIRTGCSDSLDEYRRHRCSQPQKQNKPSQNPQTKNHFYLHDKSVLKTFSMYFKSVNTDMPIPYFTYEEFQPKLKSDGATLP